MIVTKEQLDEMLRAAEPLVRWMLDNCHPHCVVIVDSGKVELMEGVAAGPAVIAAAERGRLG